MLPSANEVVLGRPLISSQSYGCGAADPVGGSVLFDQSCYPALFAQSIHCCVVLYSKQPQLIFLVCYSSNLLSWFALYFRFLCFLTLSLAGDKTRGFAGNVLTQCHLIYSNTHSHALLYFFFSRMLVATKIILARQHGAMRTTLQRSQTKK